MVAMVDQGTVMFSLLNTVVDYTTVQCYGCKGRSGHIDVKFAGCNG